MFLQKTVPLSFELPIQYTAGTQKPGTENHKRQRADGGVPYASQWKGQKEIPNFIVFTLYDRNNSVH